METTTIKMEHKTEFIRIMDEVLKDFDIEFKFTLLDIFKFRTKKK